MSAPANLVDAIDYIVDRLTEVEFKDNTLRVVTRLEDINPPCVWVALESIDHGLAHAESLLRLFLVSGDIDEYRAIKTLSPLLDAVLGVVSPAEATTVVSVQVPGQQRALPALRVTTSLTIT